MKYLLLFSLFGYSSEGTATQPSSKPHVILVSVDNSSLNEAFAQVPNAPHKKELLNALNNPATFIALFENLGVQQQKKYFIDLTAKDHEQLAKHWNNEQWQDLRKLCKDNLAQKVPQTLEEFNSFISRAERAYYADYIKSLSLAIIGPALAAVTGTSITITFTPHPYTWYLKQIKKRAFL